MFLTDFLDEGLFRSTPLSANENVNGPMGLSIEAGVDDLHRRRLEAA